MRGRTPPAGGIAQPVERIQAWARAVAPPKHAVSAQEQRWRIVADGALAAGIDGQGFRPECDLIDGLARPRRRVAAESVMVIAARPECTIMAGGHWILPEPRSGRALVLVHERGAVFGPRNDPAVALQ